MLFSLRLAPFCPAFSTILPCVLQQNALRLAPNCTAFCSKTHVILLEMAKKLVQTALF